MTGRAARHLLPHEKGCGKPRPSSARFAIRLAAFMVTGASIAGCDADVRPGPLVEPSSPAPFLTAGGPSPTQGEAQAAVDAVVQREGVGKVFPELAAAAPDRIPTTVTLFACRPMATGGVATYRRGRPVAVCHVDVLDRGGGLLGRSTMTFRRDAGRWVLIGRREREFDAR